MTPANDNNRHDVNLQQSASGTWEKAPRYKSLRPWQRLWIVTGVVYLLMLTGTYAVIMPDTERIEKDMVLAVMDEVKRYDGMAFAGASPRKIMEAARAQGYDTWISGARRQFHIGHEGDAGFARIDKEYRSALSGLPARRVKGILLCVVAWAVPMAFLYAMGLLGSWIRS